VTTSVRPLVEIDHVSKSFQSPANLLDRARRRAGRTLRAVDDVSLAINEGEVVALVGETGSGKSTLARCLMKFLEPTEGRIVFDGVDLASVSGGQFQRLRRGMQMVFQNPHASLNPRMRVADAIAEPLFAHTAMTRSEVHDRVTQLLGLVGLPASARTKYPSMFSGGQRQRICIARALAVQPRLLVADEPVSALDVSVQAQVLSVLTEIQRELGLTMLFITHDLAVVRYVAQRVAVMYLGRIVEVATVDELFLRPRHPYSEALLAAIPSLEPSTRFREMAPPRGDIPSAFDLPSGCRFHPRCPIARAGCRLEDPPLADVGPGHAAACWASIDPERFAAWPPLDADRRPPDEDRSAQPTLRG